MKNTKKVFALLLCFATVAAIAVAGTLAWLTDRESVTNTFTVGKVDITVDEADVDTDGVVVEGANRVQGNEYHLIPGQTYTKDPTMTVKAGSEESYVRMLLTLTCKEELDEIFAPGVELDSIFNGWNAAVWNYYGETVDSAANTVTYEFRYSSTVPSATSDRKLEALFTSFTLPGKVTGEQLETLRDDPATAEDEGFKITIEGHAIQAKGFEDADAAWAAFGEQYNP